MVAIIEGVEVADRTWDTETLGDDVNSLSSSGTGFTNLAFEQQHTVAGPGQGLGATVQWRPNDNWAVLGGLGKASDPVDSAQVLFDAWATFKHFAIGCSTNWDDRGDDAMQLTFWRIDEREKGGVENGDGVSLDANTPIKAWWPFFRAGYADGGGVSMDRYISIGTGYDARGGKDLAGIGLNRGLTPDTSRDQNTVEAFYRFVAADFLQIAPEIQYVANPANDLDTDHPALLGLRFVWSSDSVAGGNTARCAIPPTVAQAVSSIHFPARNAFRQ